jgi:hypothetical protein
VASRALLVLVRRVEQLDPEVLAGLVLELRAGEVEENEERPLRNLTFLLDRCAHADSSLS